MLAKSAQVTTFIDVFHRGTRLTYKKGEFIIRPGEVSNNVFYIERGLVKAGNISKYGEENLLIIRKSHQIFPLISTMTGYERDINYQALDPVTVWRITREDYLEAMKHDPQLLPPLFDMVMEMYLMHSERILNLEYRTVRERLASFLLTMGNRFGKPTNGGVLINVPLRHQDIASSINASRETASRELSYLERQGLITANPFYITVTDTEKLRRVLN